MNALRDWSFDELVAEGVALVPAHAPNWTNHNASDPGITLVELLAYFTELLVYRLGRVTPQAKLQFLRLLKGAAWTGWQGLVGAPADAIDREIDRALLEMGRNDCVVTATDFERVAVETALRECGERVRALCVFAVDLESPPRRAVDLRSHVSVVVAPLREIEPAAMARVCAAVRAELSARCLLTTRLHVVGPRYLHVAVSFRVVPRPGRSASAVHAAVAAALRHRYGPWSGDERPDELPPLGEPLHLAEATGLIDATEGVDFVEDVTVVAIADSAEELRDERNAVGVQIAIHSTPGVDAWLGARIPGHAQRLRRDDEGRLVAVALEPWEMLRLQPRPAAAPHEGPDGA